MAKKKTVKKHQLGTFSKEVEEEAEKIKEQARGKMKQRRGSTSKHMNE